MKKISTVLISLFTLLAMKGNCLPMLSSLPGTQATIFLDFDGQYVQASSWNGGNPLNCAPSGLSDTQIIEIFNRVSEDYRPFNINITTDSTEFLAAPVTQRIRIIVTPTSSWFTGVGGVAYTGSFTWGDDTPAFVFPDRLGPYNTKMVAECCTHESGHTLGLSHQAKYDSTCGLVTVYNIGLGTGQTAWAPIMGNSYYRNLSGWYNGPTPNGCSTDQDALSIITSLNGFTYRVDDHSDDPNVNPSALTMNNNLFADSGIITTSADKDVFKISLPQNGLLHFDATPYSVGADNEGADLDMKVELLDSQAHVLQVYDPVDILNVSIDTVLEPGDYFLSVQGAGNINTSNYGSLGSYKVSGNFTPLFILPTKEIKLSGRADKGKHTLSWSIISDESISNLSLESSTNGTTFTTLNSFNKSKSSYTYTPISLNENIYYRLKATSVSNQLIYSNIITLKLNNNSKKFIVQSNLVHSQITVNAEDTYEYKLADMSGRILQEGKGKTGINIIDINTNPNGIYLVEILSKNQRITERIVKL